VGSVLAAGKQVGKITTDSPKNTQKEKQDDKAKLIKKDK
jgi:hypothetical protein